MKIRLIKKLWGKETILEKLCISSNVKILAYDTSIEYVNRCTKIGVVELAIMYI